MCWVAGACEDSIRLDGIHPWVAGIQLRCHIARRTVYRGVPLQDLMPDQQQGGSKLWAVHVAHVPMETNPQS